MFVQFLLVVPVIGVDQCDLRGLQRRNPTNDLLVGTAPLEIGHKVMHGNAVVRQLNPPAAVVLWPRAKRLLCVTFGSRTIVGMRARWSMPGCGIVAPGSAPRISAASLSPRTRRSTVENSPGL